MPVVILEGKIEAFGDACVYDGEVTNYSFIKIGGKRVQKIRVTNLLNSMLKPNAVVRLACVKVFGSLWATSVQESDGVVTKDPVWKLIVSSFLYLVAGLFIFGIPATILGAMSDWYIGVLGGVGCTLWLSWFMMRNFYRARKALDGKPAPSDEHAPTE